MRIAFVVIGLSLLASTASAQAPFPGAVQVDGGWVPCDHPIAVAASRSCDAATPTPQAAPGLVDCAKIDPYVDPANALICGLRGVQNSPPAWLPSFRVGQRYFGAYEDFQMVVLSIARSLDGVEVITFQWTTKQHARVGR